jgi:hypothetical protein
LEIALTSTVVVDQAGARLLGELVLAAGAHAEPARDRARSRCVRSTPVRSSATYTKPKSPAPRENSACDATPEDVTLASPLEPGNAKNPIGGGGGGGEAGPADDVGEAGHGAQTAST